MNPPAAASPLLFTWRPPQRRRRALVVFVAASVLLHSLCFYVFQIVYPPTVALLPAPARLSVISPDDPDSIALLRWMEAEDPALASATQRPNDYHALALPKLEHIPSFAHHEPQLKTIPQTPPDLSIPSSAPIGQIPRERNAALPPAPTRRTLAVFSETAQRLGTPVLPQFAFHLSRPDAPANARFRVAIDSGGAIQHCFLVESSGDPALDEEARKFLLLCRFPSPARANDSLTWSVATILWGNDFAPVIASTLAP